MRRRVEREREGVLQAARRNEQADRELCESVLWLHHPFVLRCEERGTVKRVRGKGAQQKCSGEVVIKGETEGAGREIRVSEKRLLFNRGKR